MRMDRPGPNTKKQCGERRSGRVFDQAVRIPSSAPRIAIFTLRPGIDGRHVRIPQRGNARAQEHSGKDETYHSQCYPEVRVRVRSCLRPKWRVILPRKANLRAFPESPKAPHSIEKPSYTI